MSLPIRIKLSAYFGLQKAMYLPLLNVNFEQNVGIQHQPALSFADATMITSPGVSVCHMGEMYMHKSVMERKNW